MIKSLKLQIYLLVFVPIAVLALISGFLQYRSINSLGATVSEISSNGVIEAEKNKLVSIMESVENLIQPYVDMPGTAGREGAISMLENYTYDNGVGYIFGYDDRGIRLLMPAGSAGIGDSYFDLQDQEGQFLIRDLIEVGKAGGGFYTYYFPKPGNDFAEPKYSYAIYIAKWNLMLGTGFYIDSVEPVLANIEQTVASNERTALASSALIIFVIILILAAATMFVIGHIYSALRDLLVSTQSLNSGEADLSRRIPMSHISILGSLAGEFNLFISNMAEDISKLKSASVQLTDIASSSVIQQKDLVLAANQQEQETTQVAAAIDEMASTSIEIAQNADNTRATAEKANDQMGEVLLQVSSSSQQMDSLNHLMLSVESSVDELGNNVDSINAVLGVIGSISEQTNLLALNAAIEAARAGEQGRGFAVVADEVRSLAQRSQESTVEISEILSKLKGSSENTIEDIKQSAVKRAEVIAGMSQIKTIISSTTDSMSQLNEMNVQVATAATQQSSVANNIAETINDIATLAQNIGAGSSNSRSQLEQLEGLAQSVRNVAGKYQV